MTEEKWQKIIGNIKDNFEVYDAGHEQYEDEGGVDIDYIEFSSPMGKMRLEYIVKPVIMDKKTHYTRRIGSETAVDYVYSKDEKSHQMKAYKWDDQEDDWMEIDAATFEKGNMKAVVQRVKEAEVSVKKDILGKIGPGLLVFLAVSTEDTKEKAQTLAEKIIKLRIMADQADKMNLSVKETTGEILVVSQFTLYADTKKGNRPSFINSASPNKAIPLYEYFVSYIKEAGIKVTTGEFGGMMEVKLINDGPVTMILEN